MWLLVDVLGLSADVPVPESTWQNNLNLVSYIKINYVNLRNDKQLEMNGGELKN